MGFSRFLVIVLLVCVPGVTGFGLAILVGYVGSVINQVGTYFYAPPWILFSGILGYTLSGLAVCAGLLLAKQKLIGKIEGNDEFRDFNDEFHDFWESRTQLLLWALAGAATSALSSWMVGVGVGSLYLVFTLIRLDDG